MSAVEVYSKTYCDMNFERRGLFELLCQKFPSEKVIYPGCSIHITPSFYFQHVLYIDRSQAATDFFSDEVVRLMKSGTMELVGRIVSRNSAYEYVSDMNIKVSHREEEKVQKKCMRNTAEGIRYFDNEIYYVMRKKPSRSNLEDFYV